jgi:HK97 family phage major capsid protein
MSDTTKNSPIEVDDAVIDAVAAKAVESIKDTLVMPTADQIAEKMLEKTEKTVKKAVKADAPVAKKTAFADLDKEMRFTKGLQAHLSKDSAGMAEYNGYVVKAWQEVNKADYQNVGTNADGGSLVPDPEFIAEVERLTVEYGVAARLATVRRTDRDSVTLLSGTNEISFTKTGEAVAKNAQKLTYEHATVALDKYIATLVMTSEIVEDAAIDVFADATSEIARARAKLFDELVFTDATYGLLSATIGDTYKTLTVGAGLANFDADDAMDATYKVVSSARKNGRWFMHPTVWNEIRQSKDTNGAYLFGGPANSVNPVIDGYPVETVDIMPDSGDITSNEAFAVFGDLSRIKLHVKRLLETKVFDSGVVTDAGGTDINLITQDSWAMRATLRVVPQTRFQGAFTIIGTGTVS